MASPSNLDDTARQLIGLRVWARLLAEHTADRLGRCAGCRELHGGHVWPCSLYKIAKRAEEIYWGTGE